MKPLPKPAEFAPRAGSWIDPGYLPTDLRAKLCGFMPAKLRGERAEAFLTACAQWAQVLNENRRSVSIADQAKQLEDVAEHARALQRAMRSMNAETVSAFDVAADTLTLVREPAIRLTGAAAASRVPFAQQRFLGVAWDHVADLERIARYATTRVRPSKQDKVSTANARRLVYALVSAFKATYGYLPPKSKGGWFVGFVGHLAEWDQLKLTCGPALVQSVFREEFPSGDDSFDRST